MISRTFRFPFTVALVATMMAAVVILLALGHSRAGTSQAGGTAGAMALDCNPTESGIQTECSYAPGSSFQVAVHVTQPPTGGYFQLQAKLGWTEGVVNYLPTSSPADEALWSDCTIAARVNNWDTGVPSVFIACAPFPALAVGDTDTGVIFSFQLQCKSSPKGVSPPPGLTPNQSALDLISSVNEPNPAQGGTIFLGDGIQPIAPALTGATISCGDPPEPTPTPLPVTITPSATPLFPPATFAPTPTAFSPPATITPTPTSGAPPATPNASGAMAVDCDASQAGIQANCSYLPGETFQAEVHVTRPPAVGYFQLQTKLGWTEGVVNYLPALASDEALWSNCTIAARIDNWADSGVPSVLLACAPFPTLTVGDTFTGAVFTFEFQCKSAPEAESPPAGLAPNQSVLDLISSVNEPAPSQGGTIFLDGGLQPIAPVLTDATVTCGEAPPPTSTPLSPPVPITPIPTPLSPPGALGSINGTVTAEDTGTPLAQICITVQDPSPEEFFHVHADSNASGNYTASGLPPGEYAVYFSDCNFPATYVPEWYDDQPDFESADLVPVTEGEKTEGIDAALGLGGSINGTVTAEDTGTPLAEVCVDVVDTSFNFNGFDFTDASGNYSVAGLPSGDYTVGFFDCSFPATYVPEWYNDRPDFDSADPVPVTQGEKTEGIDAALGLGGSINGTVTDEETGTPLAEICVEVLDSSFNFFGFGSRAGHGAGQSTDDSGNYSVGGLASGEYKVGFFDCSFPAAHISEWYNDQPDFDSADLVAVTQGVKTEGIDAALALGGSINGTVTAEGTGAPLAEICVFVEDPSFTFFGFGFTDASGNYSVGGLTSGDYTVQFSDCNKHDTTYATEWYDDQPDMASADLVAVTQGEKVEGIDAALVDPDAPTPTPPTDPGAQVFVGELAVTDEDCGGGDITITLNQAGTEIVSLAVVGFHVLGSPNELVTEFDPPVAIASDGSFSSPAPLPSPLQATFEGTFDFAANPATVSGTLTAALVNNPGLVVCAADFTAEGPPTDTLAGTPTPGGPAATATPGGPAGTPTPGGPAATATPDGDMVSSVQEATVEPSLPDTGAGALDAEPGAGAGLWAMIGVLLATAAAALALSGWRYARAR